MSPRDGANADKKPGEAGDLREQIIRASIGLIEQEGLQKLSMREVARRAGVTHQAPYHYFQDREAILGEIGAEGFRLLTERMLRAQEPGMSPARRLCAIGKAYVEFACAYPAHFRIMFRPELVNLENCPGAQEEGQRAFETVVRIVHETVQAGLPAVPSEAALVSMCWSVSHGLACLILDGPLAKKQPDAPIQEQIDGVLATLQELFEVSIAQAQAGKHETRGTTAKKPQKLRAKTKRAR